MPAAQNLSDQLSQLISGTVDSDDQTLVKYSRDASIFEIKPDVVVHPKNTADIGKLVHFATHHAKEGVSLTPRAAGTCMSGGPLSRSIVLDMTTHFNKILTIGSDYVVTHPGVMYRDLDKKTKRRNLYLPPYPASRELCAVGGMVGNNAAGEQSLCYGATVDFVRRLKVVLSDGKEYVVKPLSKRELYAKLKKKDFEGQLYRKLHSLIVENQELIASAKPNTTKNSMGYYLWDVMVDDKFDLTKLLVGSQGTLGVITEIEFALKKPKKHHVMLVMTLPNLDGLDTLVNDVLKFNPESFECFDDQTMKYALKYFSEIADKFKLCSGASLYLQFLGDFKELLVGRLPKLTLIADFAGDDLDEVLSRARKAKAVLDSMGTKNKLLDSPETMEKYWVVRRQSFSLLRGHAHHMTSAAIIDDICVNPDKLPQFLPRLFKIMDKYDKYMIHTLAGHIGNGNFHILPLMDLDNDKVRAIIPQFVAQVHELVLEFGGTLAAEHNDGLMRGAFLPQMFGPKVYKLFLDVKNIFDPHNIFNPGKKVNVDFDYALSLMHRN